MTDLLTRASNMSAMLRMCEKISFGSDADVIDELSEEVARLRELINTKDRALDPFAQVADDFDADGRDLADDCGIYANLAGDFREARKARDLTK
jgi:hypothetical protein